MQIQSSSPFLPKLEGVHLFGYDGAPCSQRVSFALAEKGLRRGRWASEAPAHLRAAPGTYTFRSVSLPRHENLTEAYATIQPNMVVPALVHEGALHIESMEIIDLLDNIWPDRPLTPVDPAAASLCEDLVEAGKRLHIAVRHVTFHWSLGKLGRTDRRTEDTLKRLEAADSPERLAQFYADFNGDKIARDTFVEHLHALEAGYAAQDARLRASGHPFLTGDHFSKADIIWAIKVLRLSECGYPFAEHFPSLAAWYDRVKLRPGFREGVLSKNRFFHHAFRLKARVEHLLGAGIRRDSRFAA